jgi:ATP-dependent DNA helicase RecG
MEQKAVPQLQIDMPVKFVKGIGEYRARLLGRLGIRTPLDLMEYFPKSYMTRRVNPVSLNQPSET